MNFGLAQLGQSITREITLTNMCQATTRWSIEEWAKLEDIEDESVSTVSIVQSREMF